MNDAMKREAFIETQQLVTLKKVDVPMAFSAKGLDPLLGKIKEEANNYVADITTAKGRELLKAFAYKIKRSRTYLEEVGKTYVTELKAIPKIVDAERKRMRDELNALYDSVRKPLTEWEDEQKRIKEEKEAALEMELSHIEASEENKLFDKQRDLEKREAEIVAKEEAQRVKEQKIREEQERKEREEKIKIEAVENAKLEAEKKIAEERAAKERVEWEAKEAKEKAEREKQELIEKANREKENAIIEERVKAERRAEREQLEREKLEREKQKKIDAANLEAKELADDKEHRKTIKTEAYNCFIKSGIEKKTAIAVINMINDGEIRNITINY